MSKKFLRSVQKSSNFLDWLNRLKRFNCSLIKENKLQMWTMADYKAYWLSIGRTI